MGGSSGAQFAPNGTALSLDGTETWQIYRAISAQQYYGQHGSAAASNNVLVRRPSGEWILFLTDGRELHFDAACDACSTSGGDLYCQDAAAGGVARLVRAVDAKGTSVRLSYNRPGGVLVSLADDLGHVLQVQTASACGTGLASKLLFDGVTVATYTYAGVDLMQASDPDGARLRAYYYDPTTGRLIAVTNQSGDTITSFSYDTTARATGVIDQSSNVSVTYSTPGSPQIIAYFNGTSSTCTRVFDRNGHVTSVSDGCACGPARTFEWKTQQLSSITDSLGHWSKRLYDVSGGLAEVVQGDTLNGYIRTWRDNRWGYGLTKAVAQGVAIPLNVATSYSVGGPSVTLSHDSTPQTIDPSGYACQQSPLPTGSVLCRRIETGNTFNSAGTSVSERHATFFSYDSRGRLVRTLGPINLDYPSASDVMPVEERTYWPDTETLPRRGRLHQVERYPSPAATPLVTSYDYDVFGPYQITQPNGGTTTIVKDGRGRPTTVVSADGGQRQTRYHDALDPRVEILPSSAAVRSNYDSLGRLVAVDNLSSDPDVPGATPILGWGEYYTYDASGNRTHTERRDATGAVTWQQDRQFDMQHRLMSETNPANPTTARTNTFDASGFLTSVADEQARATNYTPDPLNRVSAITRVGLDAKGLPVSLSVARYTYQLNTISQVVDGKGQTTSYQPDDFGRRTSLNSTNLKGGQVHLTFDARGNLLQRNDSYVTVTYAYDGLNRVLTTKATNTADSSSLSYSYRYDESGALGQLTTIVEPDRTVQYGYDIMGRRTSESIHENGISAALVTQYVYATDGAVTDIIYPSSLHIQVVRDPATRGVVQLINVADSTHYASAVDHLPGGPVKNLTFGNGLMLSQTFNLRYEPQTVSSGPLSLGYGMTPAGDVGSVTEGGVARTVGYDFLDRLTGSPSWLSYAYDNSGNRTAETVAGSAGAYMYSYDLMTTKLNANNVPQFGYGYDYQTDVSGLAVFESTGTKVTAATCLQHDALGRMVLVGPVSSKYLVPSYFNGSIVCTQGGQISKATAQFKYDSQGRRVARWLASTGQTTYTVSDQAGNPLSEFIVPTRSTSPWTKVRDYVWLDGRPLAQIEYPGPTGSTQGYAYFYHLDHVGLPRYLTNTAKQTVWSAAEQPYGDVVETTSTDPLSGRIVVTNLRLPGQYDERLLGSLGLQGPYYNWHRWYLPGVGKYLELDPVALQGGFNAEFGPDWFSYANGNPLKYTDPEGLQTCEIPPDDCDKPLPGWLPDWLPIKTDWEQRCGKKEKNCSCKCYASGIGPAALGQAPDGPSQCAAMCAAKKRKDPLYLSIYKYECGKSSGGIQ